MFSIPIMLLLIAFLFTIVLLHELGHALTARRFGIETRNITLTPLGGIAQLERMSKEPWEEFWIAVAGPAVNVVLAAICLAPLAVTFIANQEVQANPVWQFGAWVFLFNVGMVVFNMVPAFPMDGGRVLRAILSNYLGLLEGTRIAVTVGAVFAVLIGVAGFWLNPMLPFIGLFVYWAGRQELMALEWAERQRVEQADEEELEPLHRTPSVVVHVWDPRRHAWVRQQDSKA